MTTPHLHDDDLSLFTKLRMTVFRQSVIDIAHDPTCDEWTFSQKIYFALDKETATRAERRTLKLLQASKSPDPSACLEEIRYLPDRNLTHELVSRLGSCQWIDNGTNLLVLGSSSVGKTYLTQTLITAACRSDRTTVFYRLDDLASQLAVLDKTDPARLRLLTRLQRVDLLVIDDFLTTPISTDTAAVVLNLLAASDSVASTLVISQFEPKEWSKSLGDAVIAESVLNRIIGGAEIISLGRPNIRFISEETPVHP